MILFPLFSAFACESMSVHSCAALIPLSIFPSLHRLSFLSCVSANAEQLDAQVVCPLLLFQVLDFITNSVGGGSNVCLALVGESSWHLWAYLNGRMRHESLPSSSTERQDISKKIVREKIVSLIFFRKKNVLVTCFESEYLVSVHFIYCNDVGSCRLKIFFSLSST